MFDYAQDIFNILGYGIIGAYNLKLFYENRKAYNILFAIFFIVDMVRVYLLQSFLPHNVNVAIEIGEGIAIIVAIVLFFTTNYKKDKTKIYGNK